MLIDSYCSNKMKKRDYFAFANALRRTSRFLLRSAIAVTMKMWRLFDLATLTWATDMRFSVIIGTEVCVRQAEEHWFLCVATKSWFQQRGHFSTSPFENRRHRLFRQAIMPLGGHGRDLQWTEPWEFTHGWKIYDQGTELDNCVYAEQRCAVSLDQAKKWR